ncbi:MAG: sulfotransferase, partial [Acidimicrobiales bacterium]
MTNQIRIDDLAAPVLNDIQRMGLEYGESKRTELTVDAVCEAAIARTGLDDFGPDDFRERLGLQFAEMDADDERTGLGRLLMFGDCSRYAANRLRIRALLE